MNEDTKKKTVGVAEYVQSLMQSKRFGPLVSGYRIIPGHGGSFSGEYPKLSPMLIRAIEESGIKRLYSHQTEALTAIMRGEDLLVATPTSSGKSLIYNLPVINQILQKQGFIHALYLFPLKALSQDQLKKLQKLEDVLQPYLGSGKYPLAEVYDGDTPPVQRQRIRKNPPPILISTPEMVHLSFLPQHASWSHFWSHLQFVIIDEVHSYRGILGSHFSWIMRRLKRICRFYGAEPQFILSSATIGNPKDFAGKLLGSPVSLVTKSGGVQSRKHCLLLNPDESVSFCASQLLEAAMRRNLRTIVYTQSRKMTELISLWTRSRIKEKECADKLSSYRAGFLPEQRREIERQLSSGQITGVISTSALELGIDIGDLDICILAGYPGSQMSVMQRAGRVGRGGRDSAVILLGSENALDQYYMKNPQIFFAGKIEHAVINPLNPVVAAAHLQCAAAELPLSQAEIPDDMHEVVCELTEHALLLQSADGMQYYSARKLPQRQVSLRGGEISLLIIDGSSGEILGDIDEGRALKECHEGAIYLHGVKTWFVERLNLAAREIVVQEKKLPYYTKALHTKQTEILEKREGRSFYGCVLNRGKLKVTERVTSFQKRRNGSNALLQTISLDLPEQTMETTGIWLEIPHCIIAAMEERKLHFMGGLHALEHLLISVFPFHILCDRNDIGGISCPQHEQTGGAAIFIYDGLPGGAGLCDEAFQQAEKLFVTARAIVEKCPCENGCPSCVHSPKCGSGNRPIDKDACIALIQAIFTFPNHSVSSLTLGLLQGMKDSSFASASPVSKLYDSNEAVSSLPPKWAVFDVETQYSAEEVGGWHYVERMGVSVAVVYDSSMNRCCRFFENEREQLMRYLLSFDLLVGFNNKGFDNRVLDPEGIYDIAARPALDLLTEIKTRLGYRLSLDTLARETLAAEKSGDGLQALRWYREGKLTEIAEYCERDVLLTRDLFLFALQKGFLLFRNKAQKQVRLPLQLRQALKDLGF